MIRIAIEDKIPFIRGVFDDHADVGYLKTSEITNERLKDYDALITRTRPAVDSKLLEGTKIRFIGSATIGLDHIDIDYCRSKGIKVVNAPGCNAPAVAQWVISSIGRYVPNRDGLTLGVVGVGNVGKIVTQWAPLLNLSVLSCDPPRALKEGPEGFVDLDVIAREADIITFHTPLIKEGEYKTYHLADRTFFDKLVKRPLILNASRGQVVDTEALLDALSKDKVRGAIIDCWEGEPEINRGLLRDALVATPHIAGYSIEGKKRGTLAMIRAIEEEFGIMVDKVEDLEPKIKGLDAQMIIESYDPAIDSEMLKESPQSFESLRDNYHYRHEPLWD
ncbi:MAG: 4-phosphoerythronate dehydrogenase [Muribaculaceae bacterium]|nr:4-phosphoerythronate dehydrogenase [Muribaculaceae bacterium]